MQTQVLQNLLRYIPPAQQASIRTRFAQHGPQLLQNLHALYGEQENFHRWLERLVQGLASIFSQRDSHLLNLDSQRANQPDWFSSQTMLGYCCYADSFGTTLQGVTNKIGHLEELGVRYLHLLPFLKSRAGENDGGFAVSSFDEIEPRLGTMQDLRALSTRLRQANISLCADFVLNHVADDHPWASKAKAWDLYAQNFFHIFAHAEQVAAYEQALQQIFPQTAPGNFTFNEELQAWVWTSFYPYQWDLNYANPEVFAQIVFSLLHLANQGVEVFRLDSTAYLWKRLGTNCMNLPQTHQILQALRAIVDIFCPAVLLKAEAIVATADLPSYLGRRNPDVHECHLAYHSSLMAAAWGAIAEQNCELLSNVIANTPALPAQSSWLTYVRCHDDIGWNVLRAEAGMNGRDAQQRLSAISAFYAGEHGSYARGQRFQADDPERVHGSNGMSADLCGYASAGNQQEFEHAQQRLSLLYGLSFAFGGLPLIYMGDELAQGSDEDCLANIALHGDGRWLQRPTLDAHLFASRHDPDTRSGKMFSALRRLLNARKQLPQLAASHSRVLHDSGNPGVLAFTRCSAEAGDILYLGNFSATAASIQLSTVTGLPEQAQWLDHITQQIYPDKLILPAWSQLWLQNKMEAPL